MEKSWSYVLFLLPLLWNTHQKQEKRCWSLSLSWFNPLYVFLEGLPRCSFSESRPRTWPNIYVDIYYIYIYLCVRVYSQEKPSVAHTYLNTFVTVRPTWLVLPHRCRHKIHREKDDGAQRTIIIISYKYATAIHKGRFFNGQLTFFHFTLHK